MKCGQFKQKGAVYIQQQHFNIDTVNYLAAFNYMDRVLIKQFIM